MQGQMMDYPLTLPQFLEHAGKLSARPAAARGAGLYGQAGWRGKLRAAVRADSYTAQPCPRYTALRAALGPNGWVDYRASQNRSGRVV